MFDLKAVGDELTLNIKQASFFPYDTGNLRDKATSGTLINTDTYLLHFDGTIAPYLVYLEEGVLQPYDIFNAFGFAKGNNPSGIIISKTFGIGGNFDGKFHPAMTKHKDFIKDKTIHLIIDYICQKYKGELR